MPSDDEEELLFDGCDAQIESEMRNILREMQTVVDSRQQRILGLKIVELRDRLLAAPPSPSRTTSRLVDYEDSSATFDGEIGHIERTLRLAYQRVKTANSQLQADSLKREIDACVDLLKCPIVQSSGPQMVAYRRVWEYLRINSLSALETVDPRVLRAVRDNSCGHSLLHKAAVLGTETVIVDFLVNNARCDINAVDHAGQTPLHLAVQVDSLAIAKRLMELNADVSIQDNLRKTPLHHASRAAIDFLLDRTSSDDSPHPAFSQSIWEIHPSELHRRECIGEGTSARVYSGIYKETCVAIKEFASSSYSPCRTEFRKEVEILSQLRHPNLVLFIGVSTSFSYQLVTELCSGGSVHSFLHDDHRRFTPNQILRACTDTLSGLVYLHSNDPQIIHMDLKSRNLLLQFPPANFLRVKIADFEIARVATSPQQAFAGTWWWMSPEALFGEDISDKSDMYSFGMCMYEILSGIMPYEDLANVGELPPVTVAIKISQGFRPDVSVIPSDIVSILEPLVDLMQQCWDNNVAHRPTALEALKILLNVKISD